MMKQLLSGTALSILLLILAACGDGGGSDVILPLPAKTTATATVSLNGTLGANAISGAGFTLTLPANVTPATVGGSVAANVVTPSGTFTGSTIAPIVTYTPAAGATPGSLQIIAANSVPAGVTTVGEIVTITLQLTNGATPAATDLPVSGVSVTNTLGAAIAGMSASVTGVTLQ